MSVESPHCIIVGSGKMGLLHGALANISPKLDVVAIVEPSFQSRMVTKGIGIDVPIYRKIGTPLRKWKDGIAIICTPPHTHFQIVKKCLENGWAVFVEKPLTMESRKSLELDRIASIHGLYNQIGYQLRFSPVTQWLKNHILESGEDFFELEISILSPQFSQISDESVGKNRGGIEWDLLPHIIDLGVYFASLKDNINTVEEEAWLEWVTVGKVASEWSRIEASVEIGARAKCSFVADWKSREVRKVELKGKLTFGSRDVICFDSDKIWKGGSKKTIFHRRSGENPYFEIADHEYSYQMSQLIQGFSSGENGPSADFLSGSIVDRIIEKIMEAENGHS